SRGRRAPLLFPYTTLFRSLSRQSPSGWFSAGPSLVSLDALWTLRSKGKRSRRRADAARLGRVRQDPGTGRRQSPGAELVTGHARSEEHTSELQSREKLVCR